MLTTLRALFDSLTQQADTVEIDSPSENLISAALLVEVMRSDHLLDAREERAFLDVLTQTLALDADSARELMELAHEKADESTSLYEFTSQVNSLFDYEGKLSLIRNMWRIAYADGEIDRYEDGVIRRVAELSYVSHSDFIRMKLQVRDELEAG